MRKCANNDVVGGDDVQSGKGRWEKVADGDTAELPGARARHADRIYCGEIGYMETCSYATQRTDRPVQNGGAFTDCMPRDKRDERIAGWK